MILYFIFVNIFLFCQSVSSMINGRTRIRKVNHGRTTKPASNVSRYVYYNLDHLTTTITTDSISDFDICNVTVEEDAEPGVNRRSIEYWYENSSATYEATTEAFDTSYLSEAFLNCTHVAVDPECYQRYQNGTVFVPMYNMLFNGSNYIINHDLLFVCPDFYDSFDIFEKKFPPSINTVSIVGVIISTACIILHIIMFALVERLRNLPGYCMLSLCSVLLVVYACSFVQFALSENTDCTIIGMIVFYALLSSFFWMNVISFDIWLAIRMATIKLRLTSDRRVLVRFAFYSTYAWGTPALIVIASLVANHFSTDEQYKLNFKVDTCWIQNKKALLIYFAIPLFIILFINIVFYISSFYMVTHNAMTRPESGTQVGSDLRSRLFLSLRLGSAMGLMWIFGVIATLTQLQWVYYLYSIFNALQGVFIFFSFTVNDKTIKACRTVIRSRKFSNLPSTSQEVTAI